MTRPGWTAAGRLAAAVDGQPAGRSWRRPPTTHPDYCARDHRCTAGRLPDGEHRADPSTWRMAYGTLVVTRTATVRGRGGLEVRADVRLDPDEAVARRQAQRLAVQIDLAVRAVLAGVLPSATPPGLPSADGRAVRPAPWPPSAAPSIPEGTPR